MKGPETVGEGLAVGWGVGGRPNHPIEGSDFILIVTSNKGYPEDLNRVLRRSEFAEKASECTSTSRVKEKLCFCQQFLGLCPNSMLSAASAGRNA